jgi:hypothetical protein
VSKRGTGQIRGKSERKRDWNEASRAKAPEFVVGERIVEQIKWEIAENRKPDKPAEQMIVGIDGAFVKGRRPTDRASPETTHDLKPRPQKQALWLK